MVLDVLIELGVPITFARTRVEPALLSGRERAGKQLQIRGTTACLELEELIFAGRDDRVAYSRDLFAPGGIEVMVMRSLDSPAPARVAVADAGAGGADDAPDGHDGAREPTAKVSAVMETTAQTGRRSVGSVARAIALLDALAASDAGLGVNELARRIGVNASTASRLLATLQEAGLVTS